MDKTKTVKAMNQITKGNGKTAKSDGRQKTAERPKAATAPSEAPEAVAAEQTPRRVIPGSERWRGADWAMQLARHPDYADACTFETLD